MRCEIWVEGNQLDLNEELDIKLSYLINDIRNFTDRETAFSKTIVIPGTAQNNFIFGNLFNVKVSNTYLSSNQNVGYNYNAAKSAQAVIYVDKMQVFKGVIRVIEITIDRGFIEYECSVYGELGGLVFAVGEKYLTDLDFSAYNHAYNATNISNSWSAAAGSGYYYPLVDYGISDIDNIPFSHLRPALYAKEYMDKIFTAAGYTYDSAFLNSTFFKNLIIPNNSDELWIETEKLFYWQHPEFSSLPVNITASPHVVTYVSSIGTQYLTQSGGTITYNRTTDGTVRLYTEVKLNLTNGSGVSQTAYIRLFKNGVDTGVNSGVTVTAGATVTPTLIFESTQQVTNGDTWSVRVTLSSDAAFTTKQVVSALFYGGGNPVIRINTQIGDTIAVNTTIPREVKQKDFLASIVKMFNLYIYEDTAKDKHLKIEPYSTFYASGFTNKKDWSAKLDRGAPIKIKPLGEIAAKSYLFKYKDDSDYYNELYKKKYGVSYGQRVFDTGLEMVNGQQKVEVIFASTVMVQYSSDDKIVPVIYKSDGIVKEPYVSVPRILLRKSAATSCGSWNLKDGSTTLATYTSYPYAGHLDDPATPTVDLCFGAPNELYCTVSGTYPSANLFNTYYSDYVGEISDKDSKLLTGIFKLSSVDIGVLDFGAFIFIDGTLYRLNKVEDYDAAGKGLTKCELLTVIDY